MKILVVEDEPLIRLGLVDLLEEVGYEVTEAAHAGEAIALLEAHQDIRLVLTDVDMPGEMDGIRLAQYVRRRWPPIQLIVVSGKAGLDLDTLPLGSRFLGKPYPQEQMIALVRSLISSEGTPP
jgi:CheY-like chemotaxis protein